MYCSAASFADNIILLVLVVVSVVDIVSVAVAKLVPKEQAEYAQ